MSQEHKDILFEGRDTKDKQIFIWGIGLFALMIGASLLMIPLTHYLWNWSGKANPQIEKSAHHTETPSVILEVFPNHDLNAYKSEMKSHHNSEKIDMAIKETLQEGYPARTAS